MGKLTSAVRNSALLLLAVTCGTQAQTDKPANGQPQSAPRQTNPTEKESRSGTRIRGSVVTEGGRPVPDASIMVFPVNIAGNMQGAITSLLRPVTSDADGKFELTSLRPGAYTISASSPGYVLPDQDSKLYRPGDTATLTLIKGGVVTGKVTSLSGNPMIGALVRAIKIREVDDKPVRTRSNIGSQISDSMEMFLGPFRTDDRGIYRIYGLSPGYYQVAAAGRSAQGVSLSSGNAYDGDAPTYHPSSTIETAAEVTVRAGEEAANIDIRYRENRGYSLGGTVSVSSGPTPQAISVLLTRANSGVVEATTVVMAGRDHYGFDTVLDGEYAVTAMGTSGSLGMAVGGEGITASVSQPRHVTVKGADVSGVNLVVEPLASIAGRTVLETLKDPKQKAACKDLRPAPIEGIVLSTRDENKQTSVDPTNGPLGAFKDTTPNEKGEFLIGLLRPGTHHMDLQLPAPHFYIKAITLPQADTNTKPIDVANSGLKLKPGDKIKGVAVTISEGAAELEGRVVAGADNKPPSMKMRVHLVPAEPEAADQVLRYFEADITADGAFSLTNLAPGKYWLVGREISEDEIAGTDRKRVAWDPGARTALKFEGEASKRVIELTQCQIVSDYRLKYIPLTKPSKPPTKKPPSAPY